MNLVRKIILRATPVLALAALAAATAVADPASEGREAMARVFASRKPATSVMTLTMVVSRGGQSLTRSLTTWTAGDKAKGEVEWTLMKFLSPADVKGSGFLTGRRADGSTESLLWLPALGRVRRLGSGPSDQDQSFFGSDFTNRDINGFAEEDFTYTLISKEGGRLVVEAKPRRDLGYERLTYTVDESLGRYVKVEYHKAGKVVKTETLEYGKVGAYLLPTKIVMASASGSSTSLTFVNYRVDEALGEGIFTERFLKQ